MRNAIFVSSALVFVIGCGEPARVDVAGAPPEEANVVAQVAFTEGPTADATGSVYFSEMRTNRIMKWTPGADLTTFRTMEKTVNGLKFDPQWRLLAAESGGGRLLRIDVETGATEVLAENSEATPMSEPNDLTFDGKGRIYFTDRTGFRIYRIDPDGGVFRVLGAPEIEFPNGIVVSPDDRTLYFVEANQGEGGKRRIMAYDLLDDGTVTNGRVFHDFYPGRSADGISIDSAGNLYAAAGLNRTRGTSETMDTKAGIHVFSPAGELLSLHPIREDTITNCGFGGDDLKTLYITAGKTLFSIRTEIAGTRR